MNYTSKENQQRLQRLQNWAARFVTNSERRSSSLPLIRTLKWITVDELYLLRLGILTWKTVNSHDTLPNYIVNGLSNDITCRRGRSKESLVFREPNFGNNNRFGERSIIWKISRLANMIGKETIKKPMAVFKRILCDQILSGKFKTFSLYAQL